MTYNKAIKKLLLGLGFNLAQIQGHIRNLLNDLSTKIDSKLALEVFKHLNFNPKSQFRLI